MTGTLLRGARRIGTSGAPSDLLVLEGRIAAVAPAGLLDVAGSGTSDDVSTVLGGLDVVDADGAWLGPGLWDHHTHFDQWALVRRRIDVTACTSAAAVAEVIAAVVRTGIADEVVIGYGFRDGMWPDQPTRELLDGAAGDVPVVVVSNDLHAVWCNTAALRRFDPMHAGHPSGLLSEESAFAVNTAISRVDDTALDGFVADAVDGAVARGVVGVVDLELDFGLDRWARRIRNGTDGIRVRSGVYPWSLDDLLARGLRTGDVVEGTSGLLTMGPFKIITDGSLNTRTAAVDAAYEGLTGEDAFGRMAFADEEIVSLVRRAVAGGLVPAVHAIGDRANGIALDVFEAVGTRGTIEHAQLLRPGDAERFARLGIAASIQPEHAMDDRDVADHYWAGRTARAFPFADLVEAGVELRLGSDAPVAPLDPWVSMAAAVGRDRDGRDPWHPEQRISALAAWRGSTDGRTTVAVGDVADLVLVERDPLAASSAELRAMRVLGTAVAGRWTHRDL